MAFPARFSYSKILLPIFAFFSGCYITTLFKLEFCDVNNLPKSNTFHHSSSTNGQTYLLFILILSAPENLDRRNIIRNTWLQPGYLDHLSNPILDNDFQQSIHIPQYNDNTGFLQLDTVNEQKNRFDTYLKWLQNKKFPNQKIHYKYAHRFVVGTPNHLITELKQEAGQFADMFLLDNFIDNYVNLTQKLLLGIDRSVGEFNFKYLLKTDDDTYVKLNEVLDDLHVYNDKLEMIAGQPMPELYWGYFNGRAQVKKIGKWKELNYNLCDRYLPYALGGGYVVSKNIAKYISTNVNILNRYVSEDISMGIWLSGLRNVYRRHDVRFDTAYMPRECRQYHILHHKRTIKDMRDLYQNIWCNFQDANNTIIQRPKEYFYNWNVSPLRCCDNT